MYVDFSKESPEMIDHIQISFIQNIVIINSVLLLVIVLIFNVPNL